MYDEIGKKIKMLAKVSFYIMAGIIGIVGIVLAISLIEDELMLAVLALLGTAVIIFLVWISTFVLYGFGELIDRACNIDRKFNRGNGKSVDYDEYEIEKKKKVEAEVEKAVEKALEQEQKRVDELKNLLKQGLITQEEFEESMFKEN